MPHALRRIVLVVLAAVATGGCRSWQRVAVGPGGFSDPQLAGSRRPVRVSRSSGRPLTLVRVRVQGDSLTGELAGRGGGDSVRRAAVALGDVRAVRVRRVSAVRTVAIVAVPLVVAATITGLVLRAPFTSGDF